MLIDEAKILFLCQPVIACSLQFVGGTFCTAENMLSGKNKFEGIEKTALMVSGQFLFFHFISTALSDLLPGW